MGTETGEEKRSQPRRTGTERRAERRSEDADANAEVLFLLLCCCFLRTISLRSIWTSQRAPQSQI